MTIDWKNALEAELSALRTAAITDAAETDQLNKACDQRAAHEYKLMGEIDALKAQNAELLAALTESLAYVEATLSNHDAGCQRHPSTEHARDCILSDLDQIKTAIAKARGDL